MSFRFLPIPYAEVGSPGLSYDGNWAAFPASDANSKWNVYFMNTTSGESRRITSDSSGGMNSAEISRDGSQVVYDRYNDMAEIAVVSPVGGASKTVVEQGSTPRWRPDGQRIGYLRGRNNGSTSGKPEFWTVKPNGDENRRELVDSLSIRTGSFAWSPDGQSVCWVRAFSETCRELIVHELSTSKERQLTFDKKIITDVSWASNDQIVFASDRGGNFNLWMIPASGGSATQVTRGAGPDYSADISGDGSKLLHFQQQWTSHIWIAGTDGSNPHQITFDEVQLWRVAFSPDGKEVVFAQVVTKKGALVCSIDRDGGNRRDLASGEGPVSNPVPSPDGRWIIYGRRPYAAPRDSSMVYLLDAKKPGAPRLVARGLPIRWVDEKTFVSFVDSTRSSWLNSIEGGAPRRLFEDSTWAVPLQGGKYIGYSDLRSGRHGFWISAPLGKKEPGLPSPKKLVSTSSDDYGEFDKSGEFLYFVKRAGELRRISIPAGKEEIIHGVFPGLAPTFEHSNFDISYDGKEIVYTDARTNSKLIMIENPFR